MMLRTTYLILASLIIGGFGASAQLGRSGFGSRSSGGFGGGGFRTTSPFNSGRYIGTQNSWGRASSGIGSAPVNRPTTTPQPTPKPYESPTTNYDTHRGVFGRSKAWGETSTPNKGSGRNYNEGDSSTWRSRSVERPVARERDIYRLKWNSRADDFPANDYKPTSLPLSRTRSGVTVLPTDDLTSNMKVKLPFRTELGLSGQMVNGRFKSFKQDVRLSRDDKKAYEDRAFRLTNSRLLSYMFLHESPGTCAIMAGGGSLDHFILDYVLCSSLSLPKKQRTDAASASAYNRVDEDLNRFLRNDDDEFESREVNEEDKKTCLFVLDLSLSPFAKPELAKLFPGTFTSAKILGKKTVDEVGDGHGETYYYVQDEKKRLYFIAEHNLTRKPNTECRVPSMRTESLDLKLRQQTQEDKKSDGTAYR